MAQWVVSCPACNREFTHTEIQDGGMRDAFLWPAKPKLDADSVKECPHCHATTAFLLADLTYSKI